MCYQWSIYTWKWLFPLTLIQWMRKHSVCICSLLWSLNLTVYSAVKGREDPLHLKSTICFFGSLSHEIILMLALLPNKPLISYQDLYTAEDTKTSSSATVDVQLTPFLSFSAFLVGLESKQYKTFLYLPPLQQLLSMHSKVQKNCNRTCFSWHLVNSLLVDLD